MVSRDQDLSQKIIRSPVEEEISRLTLQHSVFKAAANNRLLFAPIDLTQPGLKIIDSACADGCWLRDFASTIPNSASGTNEYVATDINPGYFPATSSTPPIHFQKQSFNDPWPTGWANTFNLVHQRFALAGAGSNPIRPIISNFVSLLAPGGYIEFAEIEFGGEGVGDAMDLVFTLIEDILKAIGRDPGFAPELKGMFEQEGLVDVEEKVVTVNAGGILEGLTEEEKDFRARAVTSMVMTTEGLVQSAKNMPPGTFSPEELDELPTRVEKGLNESGGLWRVHCVWGKRA